MCFRAHDLSEINKIDSGKVRLLDLEPIECYCRASGGEGWEFESPPREGQQRNIFMIVLAFLKPVVPEVLCPFMAQLCETRHCFPPSLVLPFVFLFLFHGWGSSLGPCSF